jgi:hypothetical protein
MIVIDGSVRMKCNTIIQRLRNTTFCLGPRYLRNTKQMIYGHNILLRNIGDMKALRQSSFDIT